MQCPHHPEQLEFRAVENHRGHVCPSCQGIWLSSANLSRIGDQVDFDHRAWLQGFGRPVLTPCHLRCPFDQRLLVPVTSGGLQLDWCPACQGVWFDRGELCRMMNALSARPVSDAKETPAGEKLELFGEMAEAVETVLEILVRL